MNISEVTVVVPTLNEAETVGHVIDEFQKSGFDTVVIDGKSEDNTQQVAERAGATIIEQTGSGKGQAVKQAVETYVSTEYFLLVDGDNTYRAEDAEKFFDTDADQVIGNRFFDLRPGALTPLNKFGNVVVNKLFFLLYQRELKDILSGFRLVRTDAFAQMNLSADGFGLETELAAESVRLNHDVEVVGISYHPRPNGSTSNLRPLRDGLTIVLTLYCTSARIRPEVFLGLPIFLLLFLSVILYTIF